MNKNRIIADEVGIIVSNFKVIDCDRLCEFFEFCACYESSFSAFEAEFVSLIEVACCYPASSLYVEWVVCGCVNVSGCCVKVEYLCFIIMNIYRQDFFKLCFSGIYVIRPYLVSDFYLVYSLLSVLS